MTDIVSNIVERDLFRRSENGQWAAGQLVGRPFKLEYASARIATPDAWKQRAGGIPQGCFLLAFYDHDHAEAGAAEAVLLRVLGPTPLPSDNDIVASMVEYYKDNIRTGETARSQLDTFTRYEFSFSGLECSILGSFYHDRNGDLCFGADLENFYSPHNYSVIKPGPAELERIVNYREDGSTGRPCDIRVGRVRYSSSRRFQEREADPVPVYVNAQDFAGKRTALFGMTRTGKSNSLKKIIQAMVEMSENAPDTLPAPGARTELLEPFTDDGHPRYPIGQIIFDINGEYANPNLQDRGTAISDMYRDLTVRYSTIPKDGFRELKVNFYREISTGFELIKNFDAIATDNSRFVSNFRTVDLDAPEDQNDRSAVTRHERRVAVYMACLHEAGFQAPANLRVRFSANQAVRQAVGDVRVQNEHRGVITATLDQAVNWWTRLWEVYGDDPNGCFADYRRENDREWADDDLKALLVMLTRRRNPGAGSQDCAGFRILRPLTDFHTAVEQDAFEIDILTQLRAGRIVIVDLSIGAPDVQALFSERICRHVFADAMQRFTQATPNNFIQFYFEEAHNLFPKKEEKDLSLIYNRLAKEGAKLHLGLIYATQEVSSISANILKNTQNWMVSHLNNEDEIRELKKYYDFSDFAEALLRFSQTTDKGFVRMKTYSSPFVVPVQIDRFPPEA
ncbi:MAG: ATP-binding protein [Hyphomicrobiaceae bacterium]